MREWTISATYLEPIAAYRLATETYPLLTRLSSQRSTFLLTGDCQPRLAACGYAALQNGHRVVMLPGSPDSGVLPAGTLLQIGAEDIHATPAGGSGARDGWDVALFTSLPAAYNFTFIAGVLLAAWLGARLHFSRSPQDVFHDVGRLARAADRLVVLANPVVLGQVMLSGPLPGNVIIDSGGAPLSTTAITDYRDHGIDVREGYGLTETASLTHFDTEASRASLGTVGAAMPGVHTAITTNTGKPIIDLAGPVTGVPLDPSVPLPGRVLHTTDLGVLDDHGRLRLLGRADDEQIGRLWPRDTLDAIGPVIGRRCALVRHLTPNQVAVRLLTPANAHTAASLRDCAAVALGLPPGQVTITYQGGQPLLHSAKLSRYPSRDDRTPG